MGRGFFFFSPLKQPFFPSLPKPWDLPLPSYGLLPLSLAFHIFSFLPSRISSAGHRHSFPTGSLCLDIPAPPSVLRSFRRPTARKKKKKSNAPTVFIHPSLKQKKLLIHNLSTTFQICIRILCCGVGVSGEDLKCHMSKTKKLPTEWQACSIQSPGRGVALALT